MDFKEIIEQVIAEQQHIIGPVAVQHAQKVDGMDVDDDGQVTAIERDGETLLKELLFSYKAVVGEQAVEVVKRKVRNSLDTVPDSLKSDH